MRVLVVGGDGLIGGALVARLRETGHEVLATSRRPGAEWPLDLAAAPASWTLPDADAVVICAAIARLAACEQNPGVAARVNVRAPAALARHYGSAGRQVLLLSSDKVFAGRTPNMAPDAPIAPRTPYGRQKARAEQTVLTAGAHCAVLRLTKVLDPGLALLRGWAEDLRAGRPITPFSNMYLAPVTVDFVTELIALLIATGADGIYHASGAADVPYTDLGGALAKSVGAKEGLVRPAAAADGIIPPSHRPRHSSLNMDREITLFGRCPPPPAEVFTEICSKI